MDLNLLLILAKEKYIQRINIFGDSMFAINFMNGTHILQNYTLQPIFEETKQDSSSFTHISFTHVYKNMNMK
jgi:hypothetical protein